MIRLQRVGRKNVPIFRVVLTDKRNSTKSGKYLEALGAYDPRKNGIKQFSADRIKHLMSMGAKVTDTMHNLLLSEKIITGKKINVLPRKSPPKNKEPASGASEASKASEEVKVEEKKEEPVPETPKA
ncbi:MAG: 30S ribosomal protein S16 [Candidatus Taylorbacteria bacterium RIFCSPHIGHO2_01_FULL_45_63]|uniref:30S ribosomal protein S16 n=1 Tax=Candidatus Taylorbacteria bacterium RIFCSPHIGHO2_02_FULL_45_35 TaxID=1802311 RepID=A0A1G2MVI6_9BACT|nr:MAG: 30S ribosomal protein S16 [Candidatus Taylorbacteria bacterium RIFCSPHIGHO2_01_FULL_45_63]OHA27878.1 MAG: 30S ribosomal protein S16 [Candidatus Taylorbacteria bacterium RIFCSPHIGHO2_02_FULL_45_35]OHA32440.1 MAG: 30S ribosomal protein S16 [Candidatus Taylorbacteria bacterium RIFCSPLOWO2_01_FULL_45_34b]